MPRIVVMGVSGSGKTTVGRHTAALLGVPFIDGDDLHPAANIAKMAAGVPLDAGDRAPWLQTVGETLAAHDEGVVVACSALQRSYRDRLRDHSPEVVFVHLAGDAKLLADRLNRRAEHFMPASLLASQLALLEPLADDERGTTLPIELDVEVLARRAAEFAVSSSRG